MQCKRKVCLCALLCGILFVTIATHTLQRGNLLPLAVAALRPFAATAPAGTLGRPPPTEAARPEEGVACGCPSCVADAGRSEWFDRRYDPQQQPVLTAQNASLPPLTLKWWLGLQRSAGEPKTEEVIQKMFQVISSPLPDWKPQKTRCRKCAVVGNSGNLLGSKHGPLIDSHTSVIRMNKATTSGFEEDVGNRTTHHLIYPESAVDLRPGVHLVLLPFKLRDLQWVASALTTGEIKTTYMRVKERIQADKDKVIVVNPTFFKYTHDRWTERHGRYPSTGMLAIVFSLHVCDEVSVFGYGADHLGNWHHYWENNKLAGAFRKTGVHNGDFEMQVIEKLAAAGKIKLHKR
ncbi:ST3 beta-galactoside alpha-2,3-sialyltransferase 8 [Anguilla anguilla]|uniref:ST3 beta-galactoside alpha-2,3-sialyltransferase 8 n=1 Tax=Anguilla anguilla TaxID=7936 RepID=UPI0015ABFB2C|nr:ST3 beta-galactoside alpha-2,3-sialyltransferase 8 [Anguilla anguilla]XP_035244549.1 ST3 beta-galactoside alpha-2,3-sialyltransferase 8 [Anguilla anguilla]